MINKTIFDLGFFNGDDTDFYLKKGFRVIAIDANPAMIEAGTIRFSEQLETSQLILLNRAISKCSGDLEFYINSSKPDWSSCNKGMAESDGSQSNIVNVQGITIQDLFNEFGMPYYMKVDVEGVDVTIAKQITLQHIFPEYVSFELNKNDFSSIFSYLFIAGYREFQLVNQSLHRTRKLPVEQKEGYSIEYNFSPYSSGPFGKDLPEKKWLTYNEVISRYIKYRELKLIDNEELALGWLDLHAKY